jgi:FtsZ-binding cell division protein ZapB
MYTVTNLATMFNTSRNTIYAKLKDARIKEFVYQTEKGLRLKQDGFSVLQLLLSESKLNINSTEEGKNENNTDNELIKVLREQIEELKVEKTELKKEISEWQKKYDAIVGVVLEQQKQQLLLESEKNRPFWKKIFFKPK